MACPNQRPCWPASTLANAGNTLRQLLYDPICEGSLLPLPPGAPHTRPGALRQLAATTAVFGSSGLVHEGIFW